MVDAVHAAGLRLALWHTPYLEKGSPDLPEAMQKGYFPVKSGLLLNGWSEPLDFSNPAALALWQKRLDSYIQLGIEGFKLDYGEDLVPALGASRNIWQLRDGSDERTAHYQYQLQYHQTYAQLLQKTGGQRTGTAALQFLKIGSSARATGMGESFVAVSDDISSLHWNPAGLVAFKENGMTFSYTQWFLPESDGDGPQRCCRPSTLQQEHRVNAGIHEPNTGALGDPIVIRFTNCG